jgi:hypothetical protein
VGGAELEEGTSVKDRGTGELGRGYKYPAQATGGEGIIVIISYINLINKLIEK